MEFNITDDLIAREFEELFEVVFQITSDSTFAVPGQAPMSTVTILDDDGKLKLNNEYIMQQGCRHITTLTLIICPQSM